MGGEAPALQGVAAFGHIAPPVSTPRHGGVSAVCLAAGGCGKRPPRVPATISMRCAVPVAQASLRLERQPAARWQREHQRFSLTP